MTTASPPLDPESLVARIIAELQATPGAQTLLLRAMLTNEFRGMPLRLGRIEADIAELKADVRELKADVSGLKTDISELKTRVGRLEGDVAVLKGDSLEAKLHRRIRPLLSQRLGLRRPQVLHSPISDTESELYEPVEAALDSGIITAAQDTRISATNIILRAQRKAADRSPVWVAVEVSNDISQRDIERARQPAEALSRVFCQDNMAVVAGYRIHPQDQERAAKADVHTLLIAEDG